LLILSDNWVKNNGKFIPPISLVAGEMTANITRSMVISNTIENTMRFVEINKDIIEKIHTRINEACPRLFQDNIECD
jgi:hypothetical protein